MANPKEKAASTVKDKTLTPEERKGCSVRKCEGCKAHMQDEMHGQNMRVKNLSKTKGWACTVCGQYESATVAKK